jgi:hypothetical protein
MWEHDPVLWTTLGQKMLWLVPGVTGVVPTVGYEGGPQIVIAMFTARVIDCPGGITRIPAAVVL